MKIIIELEDFITVPEAEEIVNNLKLEPWFHTAIIAESDKNN